MISAAYFSPRTSDLAKCQAWLMVTWPGMGGSLGSTTACDDGRTLRRERLAPASSSHFFGSSMVKPAAADRLGVRGEVDRLQIDAELRVALEDHLLPLDLAQRVVLDDDDLDRQLVLDDGRQLAHQHGEAAVADEADDLPARIRDGRAHARRAGRWPSSPACPMQENIMSSRILT